jgi:hypothetical protein
MGFAIFSGLFMILLGGFSVAWGIYIIVDGVKNKGN